MLDTLGMMEATLGLPEQLRDAAAAQSLSGDRYQNMLGLQRQTHVPASGPMTVDNDMTLPPLERKP